MHDVAQNLCKIESNKFVCIFQVAPRKKKQKQENYEHTNKCRKSNDSRQMIFSVVLFGVRMVVLSQRQKTKNKFFLFFFLYFVETEKILRFACAFIKLDWLSVKRRLLTTIPVLST